MAGLHSEHEVRVRIGGRTIERRWMNYSIKLDMLSPADAFSMELGRPDRALYEMCAPDTEVQVLLDQITVLTGYIDDRRYAVTREGAALSISGRDKGGRLLDESAPLMSFVGQGVQQLAEAMVRPWFPKVSLQNARNRRLLRGKGAPAVRVSSEPAIRTTARSDKKVAPGETRWHVLSSFLEEAELLAWSSCDGAEFIVGLPNYDQEPSFSFLIPREDSDRADDANVLAYERRDSVGERYSKIIASGAGTGSGSTYGAAVTKRRGVATNGPGPDGTGRDFQRSKVLYVADDDVRSEEMAHARAEREMAERDASGATISITARGHAQARVDGKAVLFAPDTLVIIDDETTGTSGLWLITSAAFRHSRGEQVTDLNLVPQGTRLRT